MKKLLSKCPVRLTVQALLYPLTLFAALVFAQLLRRPVAHMLFLFVALLPAGSIISLIIARLSLRTAFRMSGNTVEKGTSIEMITVLTNRGPFPISLAKVKATFPDKRGARCTEHDYTAFITPFSACRIEKNVIFSYCGRYRVGVDEMYIYDIFHAVKLRVTSAQYETVTVLPEIMKKAIGVTAHTYVSDSPCSVSAVSRTGSEINGVRPYTAGDSARRIHWKLSSKSEELIVKDSSEAAVSETVILCDLESVTAHGTLRHPIAGSEDITDAAHFDRVIETAVNAALQTLLASGTVLLGFMENGSPEYLRLSSPKDADAVRYRLASAEICPCSDQLTTLTGCLPPCSVGRLIMITPNLSRHDTEKYIGMITASGIPADILLCSLDSLFMPDKEYENKVTEYKTALISAGCTVTDAAVFLRALSGGQN